MEISGKGLLHFYQETSSLMGNQANHRTNMFLPYESNSCYESDYECIYIVSNGKLGSVPLNILSSVFRVYKSYHLKYTIYKPWEVKNPLKKQVRKHKFLYMIFHIPSCINPIF